jgi:uncharacterized protein (TIGR03435 family)
MAQPATRHGVLIFLFIALAGVSQLHSALRQNANPETPGPNQQKAAGGKMSFDVASVKRNTSGAPAYRVSSNFPLGMGDSYPPNGGLFSATNFSLSTYIGFAYKLTSHQTSTMQGVPKWSKDERFDIEARGPATTTKDEMRLMMQSLLADRFKLTVHLEIHQGPVFALVLAKPDEPGPNLHVHSQVSDPCEKEFEWSDAAKRAGAAPPGCDVFFTLIDTEHSKTSARNVSMAMIAGALPFPGMGSLDRPVVDQTGLSGQYDFAIEFAPESTTAPNAQSDASAPTALEALRDQLGLKLDSTTGTIETLVVDHVEEPSAN